MHQHVLASYASLTKAILKALTPERFDVCLCMFCFIICVGIDSVNLTGESVYIYIYIERERERDIRVLKIHVFAYVYSRLIVLR